METEALLADPVFQLNLLLWMAKEQPRDHYRVRPLFCELRFAVVYIEQPVPFPDEYLAAIDASAMDISRQPEPDLILSRMEDKTGLYFEAKARSFGSDSSNCKQALGHLLAAGPAFQEVFAPLTSCLLCYVLPGTEGDSMADCLASLSTELANKGLTPGKHSVHGLTVEGGRLVYAWDGAFSAHVGTAESRAVLIDRVEDDTDPTPLLLVFSDEDCPNVQIRDFYRRALLEQARASLLCDLHAHAVGATFTITVDDLLLKTTDGVFSFLSRKRQRGLRRFVRENVLSYVFNQWKDKQPGGINVSGNELTITWSGGDQKDEFLDWLEDRRRAFPAVRSLDEQRQLFADLADDEARES